MSLLAVGLVSVVIFIRMLPEPPPVDSAPKSESLLPPRTTDSPIHDKAGSPSPVETMFGVVAAQGLQPDGDGGAVDAPWAYRLEAPQQTYDLPPELGEISDLSSASHSMSAWAVNDELGTIYRLDLRDGGIESSFAFGQPADYEAIAQFGDSVLVGNSEGLLYQIELNDGGVRSINTNLGLACNLEGMAYDPARKRLLLACKTELPRQPKGRKSFAIYAMNLETRTVQREPAMVIQKQAIDDYVGMHPNERSLKPSMGEEFAPSAIAVHPITGQLYVLSARVPMLIVLDPHGALQRVEGLNPALHAQPEGITFDSEGTMYISNESRGAHALMYRYPRMERR